MDKRLTRDTERAMIAGVAAGWADYLGADLAIVRLVLVLLFLFGGIGLLFYVVCCIVMPPREPEASPVVSSPSAQPAQPSGPAPQPFAQSPTGGSRPPDPGSPGRGGLVGGIILIVLGMLLLGDQALWPGWPSWVRLTTLWPSFLIILGFYMILVAARTGRRASGS